MSVSNRKFDDPQTLWVIRDRLRFLSVLPESGIALIEITVPPGAGTPPHRHESPEIFYILKGEVTFGGFDGSGPKFTKLRAGGSIDVPSGAAHNYQNASSEPAVMLVVVNNQMVNFFREVGKPDTPPPGPPSAAEIAEISAVCARHGIELL
ncbi:MAG: cupin domain-containing protein [Oligoflexia bacterium]|nr:cupin domain-containing protein [Oligoflexia bacterium]